MESNIRFVSEGVPMAGILGVPDDLALGERCPAVVFCVGFSLVKEVWLIDIARELRKTERVATLCFDYRWFGESGGEPRCRLVPWAQVQDTRNALSFLSTRPEVDASRLGVFGMSLGASIAVGVAGTDERVRAMVSVAGPGDLERVWRNFPTFESFREKVLAAKDQFCATGETRTIAVPRLLSSDPETCALLVEENKRHPRWRLEVTFESLADLFEFKPERVVPQMRGAGMWIYPADDALVSRFEVQSMFSQARGPRELVALEGTRHAEIYANGRGVGPIVEHTRRWLRAHL